jgi:hypothetical protein
MDGAPILSSAGPLFRDIHHSQIQHFQQAVVGGKYGLRLGDLTQLAIEALYGVGGIDQPPYLLRVLEVGTQIGPVFPPRLRNLWILLIPFF